MSTWEKIKDMYWDNKLMSNELKEKLFFFIKGIAKGKYGNNDSTQYKIFAQNILDNQKLNNYFSIDYPVFDELKLQYTDPKLIAYYLPQYCPDDHNDKWWGKGTTEWTNTTKSVPQYIGHYQPRLPGELGFYDLRIQENIYRQIELAQTFGIYGFCFYFYWFDGTRLLDKAFNNFADDPNISFPYCICWVNESWTKQWGGNSNETLIEQKKDVRSYKQFIESCVELFTRNNYIKVNNRPVLNIYRPSEIPKPKEVISYWKNYAREKTGQDIYIIACIRNTDDYKANYLELGFDAVNEFSPGPHIPHMNDITREKQFVCENFWGKIYDYKEFVLEKKYFNEHCRKLHRAICPMWDNTARKMDKGTILDGATPELYKLWLKDIITETKNNKELDDSFIFLNAWNEWAEGTYFEPDLKWQYQYLEATRNAIIETK